MVIKISDTEVTQMHAILSHIHANNTPCYTYHLRSVFWAAIDVFNLFICWKAKTKNKAKTLPRTWYQLFTEHVLLAEQRAFKVVVVQSKWTCEHWDHQKEKKSSWSFLVGHAFRDSWSQKTTGLATSCALTGSSFQLQEYLISETESLLGGKVCMFCLHAHWYAL